MDQRTQFMADYLRGLQTVTELAARCGISRKTACKWIDRYKEAIRWSGFTLAGLPFPHDPGGRLRPCGLAFPVRSRPRRPSRMKREGEA